MLFRSLQECLENRCLPHYIIPESNLLENEEPLKLAEAASCIADVRKNIVKKTAEMLKRLHSLRYHSNVFHRNLELDQFLTAFQDSALSQEQVHQLMCALLCMFARQYKEVIAAMQRHQNRADVDLPSKRLLLLSELTYQSLLARCLSKLWVCKTDEASSKTSPKLVVDEFAMFVNEQLGELTHGEEFLTLSGEFLHQIQDGKDVSTLVPNSIVMKQLETLQQEITLEEYQQLKKPVDEAFGWLESSDITDIVRNVKETVDVGEITMDAIRNKLTEELQRLHLFKSSKK